MWHFSSVEKSRLIISEVKTTGMLFGKIKVESLFYSLTCITVDCISIVSWGRMAQTKQGSHLPLTHLSSHAVFTPSLAVIQNPAEKGADLIHLRHVDVSAPLLLQSYLPYIMLMTACSMQ